MKVLFKIVATSILFCFLSYDLQAQAYDILLKNGHVIDPKNNLDAVMDVAIKDGRIARVARNIAVREAIKVIDVTDLYVSPGLIDIHSHNFHGTEANAYLSNSFTALPPDGFTFRSGVTTVVDVGGAGWRNFETFKNQTIAHSKTRVLSFINIVGHGMKGNAFEQNLEDMDAQKTGLAAKNNPEIVGIKVAHYAGPDWHPVTRAVEAGNIGGVPVMIDFGGHNPPLSLEELLLEHLRPGDILTHTYAHVAGRIPIVDEGGKVRPYVWKARERGIIFDVGHGGGSFLFQQAVPALEQGFFPHTISTDIHTGSMNAGMKDQLNIMSKFLNMNMELKEIINCSTWKSAQVIKQTELGHLSEGAVADLAVLRLNEGTFGFVDSGGFRMDGNKKLECEITIREGNIVWDLNGLSYEAWNKEVDGK